ncbi:hypothetical protein GNZ10_13505 [Ralstonia sp. 3N]|uniref:hypothetical protein n=1 Tax=Ralstonia sp. 3N TaxID=2675750 RepID=UPI0015C531DD|nr:hypothetical protein [Ralstonia sp. 3N]NPT50715.1 hypothetical protein [Ralstonia sp. 3N]
MRKEIATAVAQTGPVVISDVWLWLINHELAWFVSALTIVWILSQLYWGWRKYLKEQKE